MFESMYRIVLSVGNFVSNLFGLFTGFFSFVKDETENEFGFAAE